MTKASAEGFPERVASGRRDVPPPSVPGGLGQLTATGRGDQLRRTLSHFASGVTIVTALRESIPVGFTCQSFFSLSLDPPYVAIAPSKTSTTWPLIAEAGTFCVNILSEGQEALCRSFAVSGADKFAGVEWNRSPVTSSPLLVGSLAWRPRVGCWACRRPASPRRCPPHLLPEPFRRPRFRCLVSFLISSACAGPADEHG
jgi:hypothetical protein